MRLLGLLSSHLYRGRKLGVGYSCQEAQIVINIGRMFMVGMQLRELEWGWRWIKNLIGELIIAIIMIKIIDRTIYSIIMLVVIVMILTNNNNVIILINSLLIQSK